MGGLKHHLHGNLIPGQIKNYNHLDNPMDRHEAYMKQIGGSVFCKSCGQPILMSDRDEHDAPVNWEWEHQVQLHTKCYNQLKAEEEAKRRREEAAKQEDLADIIRKQYGMDVRNAHE